MIMDNININPSVRESSRKGYVDWFNYNDVKL